MKWTTYSVSNMPMPDSPVEELRKSLPRGNWDWPGADTVYRDLNEAANAMCGSLTDLHIMTMACLGSGDEETCKSHRLLLIHYGMVPRLEMQS